MAEHPANPDDVDVLLAAVRGQTARIRTAIPGVVQSYDRATRTASVRPVVDAPYYDADRAVAFAPARVIAGVPVLFQLVTWELAVGDEVLLVFGERSLAEWKAGGGAGHRPVDFARRHDATDAVAIPGLVGPAGPHSATSTAAGAAVLEHDDIRLGGSAASSPVSLATVADAQLAQLVTMIDGAADYATLKLALAVAIGFGFPVSSASATTKAL